MLNLLNIVNTVRANKGLPPLDSLIAEHRLREDLGFDSLDLAELTARIDKQFGMDVFAEWIVYHAGEVQQRINSGRRVR